jgi:hypothetical protein
MSPTSAPPPDGRSRRAWTKAARLGLASLTAIVAWAALALQLGLIVGSMTAAGATVSEAIWRYFGFFTILSNIAVAIVASALALRPRTRLAGPIMRMAVAAAIIIVGIVYSVALRAIWEPTGWQAVADHALHDVTPPLFFFLWLASGHGSLRWRDALWAIVGPVTYCLYALARGAADGWYAYWFLDPNSLAVDGMITNIALLIAAFIAVALLLIAIDRLLSRPARGHYP